MDTINEAREKLENIRKLLTAQEYKTIAGQINAGDAHGALLGLRRIERRRTNGKK